MTKLVTLYLYLHFSLFFFGIHLLMKVQKYNEIISTLLSMPVEID